VVVSSGRFTTFTAADLLPAVKAAGVKRLAVVGGAGSLEIAPGKALIDTPEFPAEYKPEASGGRDFLHALRAEDELDWTFLSPSALFIAGERTGQFRLGGDQLLVGADGKSWISYEDFAVALLDELEQPRHVRARFTAGYSDHRTGPDGAEDRRPGADSIKRNAIMNRPQTTHETVLHYIHDPLCGWCYGAAPLVAAPAAYCRYRPTAVA
jgi:hypothetical protein